MKKAKQGAKKENYRKSYSNKATDSGSDSNGKALLKKQVPAQAGRKTRKKSIEKKTSDNLAIIGYFNVARQFLRESKIELKKVKWPTRKELLASTSVVIFISLLMAFYFWLVDMGLSFLYRLHK